MKMSADEVNVDLFNEVTRLKEKCEIASLELELERHKRELAKMEIAILKINMIEIESLLVELIHSKKKIGKRHLIGVYKEFFNTDRLKDLQRHAKGWSNPEIADVVIEDGFLIFERVKDKANDEE